MSDLAEKTIVVEMTLQDLSLLLSAVKYYSSAVGKLVPEPKTHKQPHWTAVLYSDLSIISNRAEAILADNGIRPRHS